MNTRNGFNAGNRDSNSCTEKAAIPRFTFVFLILSVLFLSAISAKAQGAVNYRFLEVVDTAGKPLADARVETNLSSHQTDEKGAVKELPVYYGDNNTRTLRVSKPGYLTYEDNLSHNDSFLLRGATPHYNPAGSIKIELLKLPTSPAETRAVEVEQRKREFLLATKRGEAVTVRKLLKAGVAANTTDVNGIPAILWAVTSGDVDTIEALLAARADVHSKSKLGRKALLYYLYYAYDINDALVRRLLKAGADVNASDESGATPLTLAKRSRNAMVVKLLKRAGARHNL